jgi:type II secretory pathway pseudopilin PulG
MRKFLFGILVGIMLTCACGAFFAIVKQQRASAAEQAARAAAANIEAARTLAQ